VCVSSLRTRVSSLKVQVIRQAIYLIPLPETENWKWIGLLLSYSPTANGDVNKMECSRKKQKSLFSNDNNSVNFDHIRNFRVVSGYPRTLIPQTATTCSCRGSSGMARKIYSERSKINLTRVWTCSDMFGTSMRSNQKSYPLPISGFRSGMG